MKTKQNSDKQISTEHLFRKEAVDYQKIFLQPQEIKHIKVNPFFSLASLFFFSLIFYLFFTAKIEISHEALLVKVHSQDLVEIDLSIVGDLPIKSSLKIVGIGRISGIVSRESVSNDTHTNMIVQSRVRIKLDQGHPSIKSLSLPHKVWVESGQRRNLYELIF